MRSLLSLVCLTLLSISSSAQAADTACPEHFPGGLAPALMRPVLAQKARPVCYSGFAALNSGLTRTPLWSAEHLTRARIEAARTLPRVNSFRADTSLPADERAELSDYVGSGFDRGHMAPNGDMFDVDSQNTSFLLSNIIPQNSSNNRFFWADLETSVRNYAVRQGELFVITGPLFIGSSVQSLKGRVIVPTHIFKAIFDPVTSMAGAYVVENADVYTYRTLSIDELTSLSGIDVFPGISRDSKARAMTLPTPVGTSHGEQSPQPTSQGMLGLGGAILRHMVR